MGHKGKKKKLQWQQYIGILIFMFVGAACGYLITMYVDLNDVEGQTLSKNLFSMGLLFVFMYVGIFLQIIIHEGGHWFFGKMSGY